MINLKGHITSDPGIMLGNPTFRGTRIHVELLMKKLADGFEIPDITGMYPHLKRGDIMAVHAYAALSTDDQIRFMSIT